MLLKDWVRAHHSSASEAARSLNVSRQLMSYYIKRGAVIYKNVIYMPVGKK